MKSIMGILFAAFVLFGCTKTETRELMRIASPDGKLDAVLIVERDGGGAIGTNVYELYVVEKGERGKYSRKGLAFEAVQLEGEKLVWLDADILEIQYKKARILRFQNFLTRREGGQYRYVEIRETPLNPPPVFEH